jgi:RimJ/RimL family protein N-acetyltransferase
MDKLGYRIATTKDTKLLANWWRDGSIMEHAGFPFGLTIDEEKLEKRLSTQQQSNHIVYIIELDGISIGELSVKKDKNEAEIGIKICQSNYQNKGLGSKVLRILMRDLFIQQGITKISLNTMIENTRAQKVYERLGFQKISIEHDVFIDQLGNKRSAVFYHICKEDYEKL